MLGQALVGCGLALIGMVLVFGLVRLAANAAVILIGIIACGVVLYYVGIGEWSGWLNVGWRSLGVGAVAAMLTLPILPFSSLYRRK